MMWSHWILKFALCLMMFAGPVAAQDMKSDADGWVTLGRFTIPAGAKSARFAVKPNSGRYNATRLVLVSGSLDVERVVVGYGNGSVHYEDRQLTLQTGERMARMDDREEEREIEFIDVYVKTGTVTRAAAIVEIGGIKHPPVQRGRSFSIASAPAKSSSKKSAGPKSGGSSGLDGKGTGSGQIGIGSADKSAAADDERAMKPAAPEIVAAPPFAAPPKPIAPRPASPITSAPGAAPTTRSAAPIPAPPPPPAPAPAAAAEASPPAGGSAEVAKSVADDGKAWTAVPIFFGTDRKREADRSKWDRKLAAFSGAGASTATWGRAVVSVPKQGREKGDISRPEWDLFFTTVALRKEDLSRDFVLLNVDVLDRGSFLNEVKKHAAGATAFKDQAFVFVHGYRVSFDDALFRAAQITHDLGFDGLPFLYSWPSSAGVAGYLYDERRALGAREPLRAFLEMVVKESGAKKVHLIAHSMGAQALLEVLRDIRNIGGPSVVEKPMFNEVILAAPDVTRDSFGQIAAQIRGLATGMTLYASANDKALRLSQKLSGASAGQVTSAGPMVISGVDSIDVSAASTDFFSLNHSTFADRAQLLDDMRLIFEKGLRPPDQRVKSYTPVPGDGGTYWRFDRMP